jgi:hypothetical protein
MVDDGLDPGRAVLGAAALGVAVLGAPPPAAGPPDDGAPLRALLGGEADPRAAACGAR